MVKWSWHFVRHICLYSFLIMPNFALINHLSHLNYMQEALSDRIKGFASVHGLVIYLIVAWLLTVVEIDWILGKVSVMPHTSLFVVCESLVGGAIVMLPFLFLPRKWRWLQLVIFFVLVTFNMINCLYFRNFDEAMPLRTLWMWQGVNSFTMAAAKTTVKMTDLIVWALLMLQVGFFWVLREPIRNRQFGKWMRFWSCIGLCVGLLLMHTYGFARYKSSINVYDLDAKNLDSYFALHYNSSDCARIGYIEAYLLQLYNIFVPIQPLSDSEIAEVSNLIERHNNNILNNNYADSLTIDNKGKNLIFIIVESLNTSILGHRVNGEQMTPFVDSLRNDSGVICYDNMHSQVLLGESSDGQFMYNTGLYPLIGQVTVALDHVGPFPSLCRELDGYECREYIGEPASLWYHNETTKAYGYDKLSDKLANGEDLKWDNTIFQAAMQDLISVKPPFFALITTLTTHGPFLIDSVPDGWTSSSQIYGYLLKANAFDNALKRFITDLKEAGIYDNTVIVIASDHHVPPRFINDDAISDGRIMLMILNSGLTGKSDSRVVGQIDVYPTVLDVMGVSRPHWPGMGQSLIRNVPGFAVLKGDKIVGDTTDIDAIELQKHYWQLSDRMIKSHSFSSLNLYGTPKAQ